MITKDNLDEFINRVQGTLDKAMSENAPDYMKEYAKWVADIVITTLIEYEKLGK